MRYVNSWVARAVSVAVFAMVGVAVMTAMDTVGAPAPQIAWSEAQLCATASGTGFESAQPDFAPAVEPGQLASSAEPVAICRLMPECWSNSECDWKCGAGLGKCIHSRCPVRLCVCR